MDAHYEAERQEVASAEPDQSEKRKAPPSQGVRNGCSFFLVTLFFEQAKKKSLAKGETYLEH